MMQSLTIHIILWSLCVTPMFMPLPGHSQSLDSLLSMLLQNNPELKAYTVNQRMYEQEVLATGQLPPTEFGLGVFALPVETRLGPQWVRLSIGQAFPWPGTLKSQQQVARTKAASVPLEARVQASLLGFQLTEAWLNWYQLKRESDILDRQITYLSALESRALTAVSAGSAGTETVLALKMELKRLLMQKEVLFLKSAVPAARINELTQRPQSSELVMEDSLAFLPPIADVETLLDSMKISYPGFAVLEQQIRQSEQRATLTTLSSKPAFSVGLDYIAVGRRQDADPAGNGRDIIGPRIGVKYAFDQSAVEAKLQKEVLKREEIKLREVVLERRIIREIEEATALWKEAALRFSYASEQRQLAESMRAILETRYAAGKEGFNEIVQLNTNLLEYELIELQSIVNSHRAMALFSRWLSQTDRR